MTKPNEATYEAADLARPGAIPGHSGAVTVIETHISIVLLTTNRAYKLKKPVHFPFLDYRTLEQREWACEEEIRLNRRLAKDVYLGVLPVTLCPQGPMIDGTGPIVDYCVEMTRLPEDALLDRLLLAGVVTDADVDKLLGLLLPFYARARNPDAEPWGSPERIAPAVHENIETLASHLPGSGKELLARLRSSQWQFLTLHSHLFESRVATGKIVEGHGDLRPEHICLLDPPVVYDCVEFSLPFRSADVLSELAFLAMECDFLHVSWFGQQILDKYRVRAGDEFPWRLAHFYKAYRATVRAKVEILRSSQQTGDDAENHRKRAHRYLQLASSYAAEFHEPLLIVTVGAAGVGKSGVARDLAERLGGEVLRTDAIRQELAGGRDPNAAFGAGLYSGDMSTLTYTTLFGRAKVLLRSGISVVLDGAFIAEQQRNMARAFAAAESAPYLILYCHCPTEVAIQRILNRRQANSDISDAGPEVHRQQNEMLKKADDLTAADVQSIDTTTEVTSTINNVIFRLQRPMGD